VRFPSLFVSTKLKYFLFVLAFGAFSVVIAAETPSKVASSPIISTHAASTVSAKPIWAALTPQQKLALAPLAPEWDKMDEIRKKKWLEIANKYAAMKPDEQARVQERMQTWMKLTPEQRMQVRENFARSKQIKPEQKSAQWQEYQQLSEEQKTQFANEANKKKSITNLPPESQRNIKPLAPIKTGPKPIPATPPAQAIQVAPANIATTNAPSVSASTATAPSIAASTAAQSSAK
jgi:tRNA nucleotidyltransferase/poly(A) polymerase